MEVIDFLGTNILILGAIVIALIILIVVLIIVKRKVSKKVEIKEEQEEEESELKKQLHALKNSHQPSEKLIENLDALARKIFADQFGINPKTNYSELTRQFKRKRLSNVASFCMEIQETLYSGEKPSKEKINKLLEHLELILNHAQKQKTQEHFKPKTDEAKKPVKTVSESYKALQALFEETHKIIKDKKDKKNLKNLAIFQKKMAKKVEKYRKNPSKSKEFLEIIEEGEKILQTIKNS